MAFGARRYAICVAEGRSNEQPKAHGLDVAIVCEECHIQSVCLKLSTRAVG